MTTLPTIEKRLSDLEARMKKVENAVSSSSSSEDGELMAALYNKAKELVLKHRKSSPIFLQKKLLIDLPRAKKLLEKLREERIVGDDFN